MESKDETNEILNLEKKVAELERLLQQKQLMIDFNLKMIEIAKKEYGIDIIKIAEKKL